MELVDSIHAQNAPPHRAEMRDESAKSKGKPPNCFELKKTPGYRPGFLENDSDQLSEFNFKNPVSENIKQILKSQLINQIESN